MAERGLSDLLAIVGDQRVKMRTRITAAISASRISPLTLSGEEMPPAVAFLEWIVDFKKDGIEFPDTWKRDAAAALGYWQRRQQKAALQYNVVDLDEQRQAWRRLLNGLLRRHLWAHGRWPKDRDVLFAEGEAFKMPPHTPELGMAALFNVSNRQQRRRRRAIDEPAAVFIGSEAERVAILRDVARCMHGRLAEFAPAGIKP